VKLILKSLLYITICAWVALSVFLSSSKVPRDDNYVHSTKEIYLADPELEAFLHQFRHHLQNEARELSRKYLLMEDDPKADYRIPYREANSMLYGEDDAVAWSRFLIENC